MHPITGLAFLMAATSFPAEPVQSPTPHVQLAVGYHISDRQIDMIDEDNIFLHGETVFAWSAVSGLPSGFVEHVWLHDGVEVARHYMPVGNGHRWRTWSHQKVKPGDYEVRVMGPDGTELAKTSFTVPEDDDC